MKRLVLFAMMAVGVAFAQNTTIDPTTGTMNLVNSGNILNLTGSLPWNNTVPGQAGGYSGGPTPAYNASTGNIIFSYLPATVSQTVQLNQALASAGTGIQIAGYYYSWNIDNELSNSGANRGTLTGTVTLSGPGGNTLESYGYNYSNVNTGSNFQTFTGTQMFANQYQLSQASAITVSFTGKDQNFWAGYYGPRVHVNEFDMLYSVNPCAQNPAYSPSCSGFSSLYTSPNLVPNPTAVATPGNDVNNSFAISTALSNSGSGLSLYGINYGFTYNLPTTTSSGSVKVGISDILNTTSGGTTYQLSGATQGPQTANYQLLTPSAINTNTLGNFTFMASVQGAGSSISNMNASLIVMPDSCTTNPLSSTNCTGYAAAYAKQLQQNAVASATSSTSTTTTTTTATVSTPAPAVVTTPTTNTGSTTVSDSNPVTTSATSSTPIGSVSVAPTIVSAPAPVAASSSGSSGSSSSSTASATASATTASSSGGSNKESASGTSIGLSVVAKNQQQNQATAMSAAANATAQAQQAGTQAQQTALSVAATAASNAVASSQAVVKVGSGPGSSNQMGGATGGSSNSNSQSALASIGGASFASAAGPNTSTSSQKQDSSGSTGSYTTQVASLDIQASNASVSTQSQTYNFAPSLTATQQTTSPPTNNSSIYQLTTVFTQNFGEVQLQTPSMIMDRFSPINQSINDKVVVPSTNTTVPQGPVVNKEAQNNEAAGNVDINKMAKAPTGYGNYLTLALKDASFYAPKEVYKNQKTVDNVRALRQLTNDNKHREMVELQYVR